jgi:hypothetical protein
MNLYQDLLSLHGFRVEATPGRAPRAAGAAAGQPAPPIANRATAATAAARSRTGSPAAALGRPAGTRG